MSKTLMEVQQNMQLQLEASNWFGKNLHNDITHAAVGISEEAGELLGLVKKDFFRGKHHEPEQWLSECGDILWYLVATIELLGFTLDDVWDYNCRKLEERRLNGKNGQLWEG